MSEFDELDDMEPWAEAETRFKVATYAYCGMRVDHGTFTDEEDARSAAAGVLRRRRRSYPVVTLERGRRWEIQCPDDALMVPDACGILKIYEQDVS